MKFFEAFLLSPIIHNDDRGLLLKFPNDLLTEFFPEGFLDEYWAKSNANVFRGLHRQAPPYESNKFFFLLDGSATFFVADGSHVQDPGISIVEFELTALGAGIVVPGNMFTGYKAHSSGTIVLAKGSNFYKPEAEEVLPPRQVFDDEFLRGLILSEKDT